MWYKTRKERKNELQSCGEEGNLIRGKNNGLFLAAEKVHPERTYPTCDHCTADWFLFYGGCAVGSTMGGNQGTDTDANHEKAMTLTDLFFQKQLLLVIRRKGR